MSKRSFVSLALVLLGAGACSDPQSALTPLVFNRPEYLGFVCLDTAAAASTTQDDQANVVLPLGCCAAPNRFLAPFNSPYTYPTEAGTNCGVARPEDKAKKLKAFKPAPTLHALVTQSTRGEVAAFDTLKGRVIDTDRRVPGYTYLDVGGLPSAIVTPPSRYARNEDGVVVEDLRAGPTYTYVASAEELHVRAIPTCRFRSTRACGPELSPDFPANTALFDTMRMPLPSPPRDMVLGPDHALWVTLPEQGLLARIELDIRAESDWPKNPTEEPIAGQSYERPFRPVAPQFFALSDLGDLVPAEAVAEESQYRAACGLGYVMNEVPVDLKAPVAPPFESLDAPRPLRLRVDKVTGYLLVGDQSQPGIRAFDVSTGTPQLRGVIATGSPVREFVVTPYVPSALLLDGQPLPLTQVTVPRDDTRYLYAIDERDGSVLLQRLDLNDDGTLSGTPLQVPYQTRYRDRITFGSGAALSLEIIDTRDLSAPLAGVLLDAYRSSGPNILPNPVVPQVTIRTAKEVEDERVEAVKAWNMADTKPKKAAALLERYRAEAVENVYDNATPPQMRGVFLAVTTSNGDLLIYDIHDLDVFAKARNACVETTATKDQPQRPPSLDVTSSTALPVAIQRHAVRPYLTRNVTASVSDASWLVPHACSDGYHAILDESGKYGYDASSASARLCARDEPWLNPAGSVSVSYNGALPTLPGQVGHVVESDDSVAVMAPPGVDLCERGVASTVSPVAGVSDAIIVTSLPSPNVSDCAVPSTDNPVYLKVTGAYRDRLVLEDTDEARELLRCYPDTLAYSVRGQNHFIVSSGTISFTPTTVANADGACIPDPEGDPDHGFRALPGKLFKSQRLEFTVRGPNVAADEKFDRFDVFTIAVSSTQTSVFSSIYDAASGRPDSLPVTVRYLPYTGDLYIIDTASQGIRRYGLAPFGTASTGVR